MLVVIVAVLTSRVRKIFRQQFFDTVLYDTNGFPKLIYCASWSTGTPAKELFGLCAESANVRVLCFTYFVVIHNTPERESSFNQREKSVRTMKYKLPAQISRHTSYRNKLETTAQNLKERERMTDALQKKLGPSGISGQDFRLLTIEKHSIDVLFILA